MITNVYIGFIGGVVSWSMHFFMLLFDDRKSFKFYNFSLLVWVTGNFLWMLIEFCDTQPSSHIHFGPTVPIGGIPDEDVATISTVKGVLFYFGALSQVVMYLCLQCRLIKMPQDEPEDEQARVEAVRLLLGSSFNSKKCGSNSSVIVKSSVSNNIGYDTISDNGDELENGCDTVATNSNTLPTESVSKTANMEHNGNNDGINETVVRVDSISDVADEFPDDSHISLAFIENIYIIFWISKDLFWSWGTGDFINERNLAIFYESAALSCGLLSITTYLIVAYANRYRIMEFLDAATTIFWISANFVWMSGELFIRYDNLQYDDETAQNDGITRIISSILFCCGITIQAVIFSTFLLKIMRRNYDSKESISENVIQKLNGIEMTTITQNMKYTNILTTFSPQHSKGENSDDEDTILF